MNSSWKKIRRKTAAIGKAGEKAAAAMFKRKGCILLIRNCRTPRAELDLVLLDGKTLVFAEVKTLYHRHGSKKDLKPSENLKWHQKRRIWNAAYAYLHELGKPELAIRFDLVEVIYGAWGPEKIFHHPGIFNREDLKRAGVLSTDYASF